MCDVCGAKDGEVDILFATTSAYICNECVEDAYERLVDLRKIPAIQTANLEIIR